MSKSIKESSINLGDTEEEIYSKIVNCGSRNEEVILQMMVLASNWSHDIITKAKKAYENMSNDYDKWFEFKNYYYNFFISIKKLWDESKNNNEIDTYNELFK